MSISLPVLDGISTGRGLVAQELPTRGAPARGAELVDSHGRVIRDLRLSITDRCNMRCVYCMDPDTTFAPRDELLTAGELVRVARVCVGLGVERVRITGGEPTLRPDLVEIVSGISALGVGDISMTTNGTGLDEKRMVELREAGLRRLTFSMDSLDTERYQRVTRSRWTPGDVIEAMRAAKRVGLEPVRFNCVVMGGFNDDELVDLARLAWELEVELRLIEFMPLDGGHRWTAEKVVPSARSRALIERELPLVARGREKTSATATRFGFADGRGGGVGFISPVSDPFCGACSRLRITADGKVRACLFGMDQGDLRGPMRAGASDDELADHLHEIVWHKRAGHGIGTSSFERPEQAMNGIGG